jgi:hypothetical protein
MRGNDIGDVAQKAGSNFREGEINCSKNCNSKLPPMGDN